MKRILAVAGVLVVLGFAASAMAFGIPDSVSDVADAPKDMAYEACQSWEKQHENNTAYNMGNIRSEMSGSDFSNLITETDKPDRLELRATYQKFATVKVRCNKEKCHSIWCNKN